MQCNNERQQNCLYQVITYHVTGSYNRLAYISLFLASWVQEILFTCLLGKVINIWVAQLVIQIKCGELTFILTGFACSLLTINEKKFKNISRQPLIQSKICPTIKTQEHARSKPRFNTQEHARIEAHCRICHSWTKEQLCLSSLARICHSCLKRVGVSEL